MKNLKQAAKKISKAGTIAVACHVNPDGDAIGSLLSLGEGLRKLGKRVYMVSEDGVPRKYKSLPGAGRIVRKLNEDVDLAITVDCNSKEMLGNVFDSLERAGSILEIDHHQTRKPFGDVKLIDCKAAAVGELVYMLLEELGVNTTRGIARNILTSLIVETNSFRLPNVRPLTFEICARLVRTGVDFYKLVDTVYWSHRREDTMLSGLCLARCKFLKKGRLVWSVVRRKDFERIKGKDEDVDSVADKMRAIKGVDAAVFFREKSREKMRVSLRAKKDINIARLAASYGGGGHSDVAGCAIANKPKVMKELLDHAKTLL